MDAILQSDLFSVFRKTNKPSRLNVTSDLNTNRKYNGNISLIDVDIEIGTFTLFKDSLT